MKYRERRLTRYFQDPEKKYEAALGPGSTGIACRNIRAGLRYLGYSVADSDVYDDHLIRAIEELQSREGHKNRDGLTGPGTRSLLVRALMRKGGERSFTLMTFPKGVVFPRVFVSYAREDRRTAEQVVDELMAEGVDLWVDYINLEPGANWKNAIEHAIPDSRYFLALLSRYSLSKKGFVQSEIKTAWSVHDLYPEHDIFVIPARLEECEVNDRRFRELNYIDLFPNLEPGLRKIIDFLATADCKF
jgi:hypothetical protein